MRFTININQQKCLQHGLTQNQGGLMDLFGQLASWATERVINGKVYWHISRNKVIEEIPLCYEKPDTVYRAFKILDAKNLIEYLQQNRQDYVRLTSKGQTWNKVGNKSEKIGNESEFGNESEQLGNKSELGLLVNPTVIKQVNPILPDLNPTYNIHNTTNDKREANALAFLASNFPSEYESWMMKFKTNLGEDFSAMCDDFNCKVVEEGLEWESGKLFARLTRLANNWIRNNFKNGQSQNVATPQQVENLPYRKNIV